MNLHCVARFFFRNAIIRFVMTLGGVQIFFYLFLFPNILPMNEFTKLLHKTNIYCIEINVGKIFESILSFNLSSVLSGAVINIPALFLLNVFDFSSA